MKTAIIYLHGNLTDTSALASYIKKSFLIICADGGAEHARKQGILPHVVIGDLDSISASTLNQLKKQHVQFITYPREKDLTDAELAFEYAIESGAEEIVVAGFLGDRIDHLSANLLYIAKRSNRIPVLIIEHDQEIRFVQKKIVIKGQKGDELSLIPINGDCVDVSTGGLQYQLRNEMLPLGSTRGISNVFMNEQAEVRIKNGILMLIHRKRAS